jgi:hypothetical protein
MIIGSRPITDDCNPVTERYWDGVMSDSTNDIQKGVQALVTSRGIAGAARDLGVAKECVIRLVAGLPVQNGTKLIVREALRKEAIERSNG